MRVFRAQKLLIFAVFLFGGSSLVFCQVSAWQMKSATINFPNTRTDYAGAGYQAAVREAISDHYNAITLPIPLRQTSISSTDVGIKITGPQATPTDAALASGIAYARGHGLKVMLKIHVFPADGQWSANINPTNRSAWFTSFGTQLYHYAALAQANHVEWLCIGTELAKMSMADFNSTNTSHWNTLISGVRARYTGKITYSANWGGPDEKNRIGFGSKLNAVGVAAYYRLNGSNPGATVSQMAGYWSSIYTNDLAKLIARVGKPIFITEIGYRSTPDNHDHPYDWCCPWKDPADLAEQQRDYQAFFQFWNTVSATKIVGVALWNWQMSASAGGSADSDYTPQNKPAESVIAQAFAATAPAPQNLPIDIWWPTNGAVYGPIAGGQPYQALISSRSIDSYTMVWFEDKASTQTHAMLTNLSPAPHKQDNVDVTQPPGPGSHTITFVAFDATTHAQIGIQTVSVTINPN